MPEDFSEIINQSVWALVKHVAAIADVLKKELPFYSLTASCHVEDGRDDFTGGILARWGERYHSIMISTRYLDEPPEPKEVYPESCCAVGMLQVFPRRRCHEKRWRFAGRRTVGWLITTANGFRCPLLTSLS